MQVESNVWQDYSNAMTCIAILLPEEDPSGLKRRCIVWWWSLCSQKLSTILTDSFQSKTVNYSYW